MAPQIPQITDTMTVTPTNTVLTADGFPGLDRIQAHVEWQDDQGVALLNSDGNIKVKADGSVNIAIPIGSDFVNEHYGTYARGYARLTDDLADGDKILVELYTGH